MNCAVCGNKIQSGANKCELCGSTIDVDEPITNTDSVSMNDAKNNVGKRIIFEQKYGLPPYVNQISSLNNEWKIAIMQMGTTDILSIYDNVEEYCNEYRFLCYEELWKRYISNDTAFMKEGINIEDIQTSDYTDIKYSETENNYNNLFCENCGAELIPNSNFCDECGSAIKHIESKCKNCGYVFERIGNFCPICGCERE